MPRHVLPPPPSRFTAQIGSEIVCRLSSGRALTNVCRDADMPNYKTVAKWIRKDPLFAQQVAAVWDRSGCRRSPGCGKGSQYTDELARRICVALRAGFTLTAICADPSVPVNPRTVRAWAARRPDFAGLYAEAIAPRPTRGGLHIGRGRHGAYSQALADEVIERLLQGRSLIEIARGPDMPSPGVIRSWRRRHVDFYFALQAARRFQLELLAGGLIDAADTARPVGVDRSVIAALLRYGYGE